MFSDDGPPAWKTKKGHSRIDREVQEVISAQAKGEEARGSISKVIEEEKRGTTSHVETKNETSV